MTPILAPYQCHHPIFLSVNVQDDVSKSFMCSPMKLMKKVTLKGGLKAGDFTDTGKVRNYYEMA